MENLSLVAVRNSLQQLISETLDDSWVKALLFAEAVHILLEIVVEELEDKDELAICMDDFTKRNDVRMCQLFEDGDFTDGGGRNSFFFAFKADLFEGKYFTRFLVCIVDSVPLAW